MRALRWPARILLLVTVAWIGSPAHVQETKPALSGEDEKLLQGLLRDYIFDPTGAQRVALKVRVRSVWGGSEEVTTHGWLVKNKDGERVFFTDGAGVPAPPEPQRLKVDFLAECRKRYAGGPKAKADPDDPRERFALLGRNALGLTEDSDLVFAAWLYRLGEKELAARALGFAPHGEKDVAGLRKRLAWSAYAGMVHAFMARADEEALEHGTRLLRLYPTEAKEHRQTHAAVRDLERRKQQGTFGKKPAGTLPKDFPTLETKRQIALLIEALEEVDARQDGQPGGVDLAGDFRVAALIKIGEPAVSALLDVLEKDERLTRSVHFWRDFAPTRTVLSVREAALTALMSILRVRVFEPRSTGDNFTSQGEEGARQAAQKLRAYWKEFGGLSFDERMMKVLNDPGSRFEAMREAADNLARPSAARILGTTAWSDRVGERPQRPNPAIKKFSNPSAAEVILAAMDRDLAHHDGLARDFLHDFRRRKLEDAYLLPLIELGDHRVAAVLAKRAENTDSIRMRRKWAHAAYHLGDPRPIKSYADDFRAGKIVLPANDQPQASHFDQPGYVELQGIVKHLSEVALPEADRALATLADRNNPAHPLVAKAVLAGHPGFEEQGWWDHPYCLTILRAALEDEKTRAQAETRLAQLVVGLPASLKDRKEMLDRFQGKFRRATKSVWRDEDAWGNPRLEPAIVPLDRPATAADVQAGRAVFHLDGKGKTTPLALPAIGIPRTDPGRVSPLPVLIVQAETAPDGATTYGIIARHAIRPASATDFARVTPLQELKQKAR